MKTYRLLQKRPRKALKYGRFRGLIFHTSAPLFSHVIPLLLSQGSPGAAGGAIPCPAIGEKDPAAYRAGPGFRGGAFRSEGRLQHGIIGQHRLPEAHSLVTSLRIAAFSSRVSSRATVSPPAASAFQQLPIAGHAPNSPPVGAAVADGALRGLDRLGPLIPGNLLHHRFIGTVGKFHLSPRPPFRPRPPRSTAGYRRRFPARPRSPPRFQRPAAAWGGRP